MAPPAPSDGQVRWYGARAALPVNGTNAVTFGPGSTGTLRLKPAAAGNVAVRVTARNKAKRTGTSPVATLVVR